MAKVKSISSYRKQFEAAMVARHGEYNAVLHGLVVQKASMDFHLLEVFMNDLENADLVSVTSGSMSQPKQEVNPLIDKYNNLSKTCQAVLDSLMLTPSSTYKKVEGKPDKKEVDPMKDYFSKI